MRDARQVLAQKFYCDDLDALDRFIRSLYPIAKRTGSLGAWSWVLGPDKVVAEAWTHRDKPGWWARVQGAKGMPLEASGEAAQRLKSGKPCGPVHAVARDGKTTLCRKEVENRAWEVLGPVKSFPITCEICKECEKKKN